MFKRTKKIIRGEQVNWIKCYEINCPFAGKGCATYFGEPVCHGDICKLVEEGKLKKLEMV